MSEEKGYTKGLLLGILAGGITGGLIGLFYAPKSGREFRKDIANKKNELIEEAGDYVESAKAKTSELFAGGKKIAGGLTADARRKASEISQNTEHIYNSGKETISNIKKAFKSGVEAYNDEREKG